MRLTAFAPVRPPRRLPLAALLALALLPSCVDRKLGDDPAPDVTPPLLHVVAPARATRLASGVASVLVEGTASDDRDGLTVTVNGEAAELDAEGRFSKLVTLEPGITSIRTVATDAVGLFARDARAVLSGPQAPGGTTVKDAVDFEVGPEALVVLSDVVERQLEAADFNSALPTTPIMTKGGSCLGADVYLTGLRHGSVDFALTLVDGGLAFDVQIFNVEADLKVDYRVACIDGSSTGLATMSRVHVTGVLAISIDPVTHQPVVAVNDAVVTLDDFSVSLGSIPQVIFDLISPFIADSIATKIKETVTTTVVEMVTSILNDLAAGMTLAMLGQQVTVAAQLTAVDITPARMRVVADSRVEIAGASERASFIVHPMPLPEPDPAGLASPVRLAVADDWLNEALAAFWASGALDRDLVPTSTVSLTGVEFDVTHLAFQLPPVTYALPSGGGFLVQLGDLFVDLRKGGVLAGRIAVSGEMTVTASIDSQGAVFLQPGSPHFDVDVVSPGAQGSIALDDAGFESLVAGAVTEIVGGMSQLALGITLPAMAGVSLRDATVSTGGSLGGYLILDGSLVEVPP